MVKLPQIKCEWCGSYECRKCHICEKFTCFECVKYPKEGICIHERFIPIKHWDWNDNITTSTITVP